MRYGTSVQTGAQRDCSVAGATVAGAFILREGAIVPEGAVVETPEPADALPVR